MSDFALQSMQSAQAPRDVELQPKLATRGFNASAFAHFQGDHLMTHPGVPRVVAHENWAVTTGTGEGMKTHPALLQKMATFSPYVGFRPVPPSNTDVPGICGVGVNQFPGMAATKPEVGKQSGPASNSKEKEPVDPSLTIQPVRAQTLAAHNMNSKEPTEKDRFRKIEEWRNDVAKASWIPQGEETPKTAQGRERRHSSHDCGSEQKESKEQKSAARGSSSQSRPKEGKKEGKSAVAVKKGKGKASTDKEEQPDVAREVSKSKETKSDDKHMEQKRESEQPMHWGLPQQPGGQSLFNAGMYAMPFNPSVIQHQLGVPFGLSLAGRTITQSDIPVGFPYPVVSRIPAFPNYALGSYMSSLLQSQSEQMHARSKGGGSASKESPTKPTLEKVQLESQCSGDGSKKEKLSSAMSGIQVTSELTEASSRATLAPGQQHYKLVKRSGSPGGPSGKGKPGEGKQRVGKGRKPNAKEQKVPTKDSSSTSVKPGSPVSSVVTASVAQVASTVPGSTSSILEYGQDKSSSRGLLRGRKTKADTTGDKSPEKRMKTTDADEQKECDRVGVPSERQPPISLPLSFRNPSNLYGPLHSVSDEQSPMAQMPFVASLASQAAMYGHLAVKQGGGPMPPFGRFDHAKYYPRMFKQPDVPTMPPSAIASRIKDDSTGAALQSDGTDRVGHPIGKPPSAPKRPNTLSFVSDEIRNLPGGELLETQTPEEIEARAREFDRHEALRTLASPVRSRHFGLVPPELPSPSKSPVGAVGGRKVDGPSLQSEHSAFSAKNVKKKGSSTKNDNRTGKGHVKKLHVEISGRLGQSGNTVPSKALDTQQDRDMESNNKQQNDVSQRYRVLHHQIPSSGSLSVSTTLSVSTGLSSPGKLPKKSKPASDTKTMKPSTTVTASSPVKSRSSRMDVNTSGLMQQFERLGVSHTKTNSEKPQPVSTNVHTTACSKDAKPTVSMSTATVSVSAVTPNLFVTAAQSMLQDALQNTSLSRHGARWPSVPFRYGLHDSTHQSLYSEWLKQHYHQYVQQQLELERKQIDRKPQSRKGEIQQKTEQRKELQAVPTSGEFSESSNVCVTSQMPGRVSESSVMLSSVPAAVAGKQVQKKSVKGEISKRGPPEWRQKDSRQDWQLTGSFHSPVVKSERSGGAGNKLDVSSGERKHSVGSKESRRPVKLEGISGDREKRTSKVKKSLEPIQVHVSTDIEVMNVGQSGEGLLKASPQEKHDLETQLLIGHALSFSTQQPSDGCNMHHAGQSEPVVPVPSVAVKSEMYNNCRIVPSSGKVASVSLVDENSRRLGQGKNTFNPIALNVSKTETTGRHGCAVADELPLCSLPVVQTNRKLSQKTYNRQSWTDQRKLDRSDAESSGDELEYAAHLAELAACNVLTYSDTEPTVEDKLRRRLLSNESMEYEIYEWEELGQPVNGHRVRCLLTGLNYYSLMKPYLTSNTDSVDRAMSQGMYRQYKTEEGRQAFGDEKSGDLSMDVTTMSKQEVKVRVSLAELQQQYKNHLSVLSKIRKKARRHARKMKATLPKDEDQKLATPRKRGRPRKHKLIPVKTHGSSSDSQSETEGAMVAFPVIEPAQGVPVVKKRGRGRPPKDPTAANKPGKKKPGPKVEKSFIVSSLQKMSCLTSDDEAHEQVMSLKQNSVKQRHSVRSGMMDNLGRKQEDSDADFSASIPSDSTYDADEDKVAMKSAKAGWRRRKQRAKKTDDTIELNAQTVPLRKRGRPKAQTIHEHGIVDGPRGGNGEVTNDISEDFRRKFSAGLPAHVAATSGLDALSRCASMALAMGVPSGRQEGETTVESMAQPRKRGRKARAVMPEGNAVDGGAALAVSESQAEDLSAGQNEQLYVDSSEVGSVAVPMENSLVDSLNGKKPEMGNNKESTAVHQKSIGKDMASDKPRIRKGVSSKCVGESLPSAPSRKTGRLARKESVDLATLEEDEQTRRPPAKRARLSSQERTEIETRVMEPANPVAEMEDHSTLPVAGRNAPVVHHKVQNSGSQNHHHHQSNWQLSPAVLTVSQQVLVRDLEEPRVYSFATIVDPKPPDLYGVVVDGDRRRKVHWLSQEEIIDKGVLDVKPSQDSGLPEGCRVCARWSAHQKCYYPGRIIDDVDWTTGQCFVEFDDGDQAWKRLELVRRVMDSDSEDASVRSASPTEDVVPKYQSTVVGTENSEHSEAVRSSVVPARFDADQAARQALSSSQTEFTAMARERHPAEQTTAEDAAAESVRYSPISESCEAETVKQRVLNSKSNQKGNPFSSLGESPASSSLQSSPFAGFEVSYSDISSVGSKIVDSESELVGGDNLDGSGHFSSSHQVDVALPTPPLSGDLPSRCVDLGDVDGTDDDEWEWCGKGKQNHKRGRGRRTYFKAVTHRDYTLNEGDTAIFKSSSSRADPYIGIIEKLYEGWGGTRMVRVKWYYRGNDIKLLKPLSDDKAGVYLSLNHVDNIPLRTVVKKCQVLSQTEFNELKSQPNRQRDCVYYKKGVYNETTGCVDPSPA